MKPLIDARREVLEGVPATSAEIVHLSDALGRVTTEAVRASEAIPPFANSAVDGFAVRSADMAAGHDVFEVVEDVAAGSVPTVAVGPGEATRIMTGAPVPEGADAIVMVEDSEALDGGRVRLPEPVAKGSGVRPAGSDLEPGDLIVDEGVRLNARHLASLASIGSSPVVARRPTVAIMSTGDEVVPFDADQVPPGAIRDTNRLLLASVLGELGVPILDLGIVGDDVEELRAAYTRASSEADVIVSTGGVSMGDYDYVKQVLGETGSVRFWKVAMQPAKPFAFGHVAGTPLFGLPGNPVSTFVAFEQFVRPAILHMMGSRWLLRPRIQGVMGEDVSTSPEKEVFVRVILAEDEGTFIALRSGGQGSNVISALASADAFAVVPVGVSSVSAGDPVTLEMFTWAESRTDDD